MAERRQFRARAGRTAGPSFTTLAKRADAKADPRIDDLQQDTLDIQESLSDLDAGVVILESVIASVEVSTLITLASGAITIQAKAEDGLSAKLNGSGNLVVALAWGDVYGIAAQDNQPGALETWHVQSKTSSELELTVTDLATNPVDLSIGSHAVYLTGTRYG